MERDTGITSDVRRHLRLSDPGGGGVCALPQQKSAAAARSLHAHDLGVFNNWRD